MDYNICPECGTENESDYIYCKNCGVRLTRQDTAVPNKKTDGQSPQTHEFIDGNVKNTPVNAYTSDYGYSDGAKRASGTAGHEQNPYGTQYGASSDSFYGIDDISGIPTGEIALFVGQKADGIIPKFKKMEITGSKVSWCWPAALLGFFLGPLGICLWFFYRKMHKVALILLAAGIILTAVTTALKYDTISALSDNLASITGSESPQEIIDFITSLDYQTSTADNIAQTIYNSVSLLSCALAGIFAFYLYKEHTVKSIREFRSSVTDRRYYQIGLATVGGVSGGMLAFGIIVLFVVNSIAYIVPFVL